jgi:exodeoxyribonuclease V alpha subunit
LDAAFADLCRRIARTNGTDGPIADFAAYAGATISRQVASGHSCALLGEVFSAFADCTRGELDENDARRALLSSGVASEDGVGAPLVVDDGGRIYLQRLWAAEKRIADKISKLCKMPGRIDEPGKLAPTFAALFPEAKDDEEDLQAVAAGIAVARRLAVVSGGPGTGKTSTVAKILALLTTADPGLKIALGAPTGKAAHRLGESIAIQSDSLPISTEAKRALKQPAATLHRLLGYNPRRGVFAKNADSPLAADVVVIDEASMVDVTMFDALLEALRPDAALLLLGDAHQLESVGAGSVFGDICSVRASDSRQRSADFCRTYEALGGKPAGAAADATAPEDCIVELCRSYRFDEGTPFAALADSIRTGDAEAFFRAFEGDAAEIVAPPDSTAAVVALASDGLDAYAGAQELAEAFAALDRFRILCALREGPLGAIAINEAVARRLRLVMPGPNSVCYDRRALLVTANNYSVKLFNGDVGICWSEDGETTARFPSADGGMRKVATSKLPPCESAWAMTVHKSQGSEFDDVVLVLPDATSPILSRELLYTGITRAKSRIVVVAEERTLRAALSLNARRASGLGERLVSRNAV